MSQFNTHRLLTCICLLLTIGKSTGVSADLQQAEDHQIEEIVVWGTRNPFSDSSNNPVSRITPRDAESINAMTTEDLVKFEPGIIIRQRFIGDANGTMGIRGSNMFQTARSMVFADGVPLHYFLQTRWNGSPRWSLVSADEIAEISIFYGPFSAEYGGNAMAGVVNIETAIPTERNFHTQISGFQQNFDSLGSDNKLNGHKIFLSYGDKIGDFSVYGSFNRLTNDSHPQSYYFSKDKTVPAGTEATPVSGGVMDVNEYNDTALYYGNAGATEVTADQLKFKIGYEHNDWFTMVNLAFEDRESNNIDVRNYLKTDDGTPMWNGWVEQNGMQLEIESDDFAFDKSNRKSLLIGGRSRGPVGDYSYLELGISHFSILEDETLSTNANPADPAFVPGYDTSREYGDTGWSTFDIKLLKPDILSVDGLNLLAGYHHDRYELEIENSSGGKSQTQALFGQIAYPVSTSWHLTLGGRYEKWESEDGFYIKRGVTQHHPDRTENHFSPKFVLAF
ncbi:MAG: TonB-dependent receptor, partial [Gammaproteobacteria bacterium]|nr:TonB-dependent receptor [Gammaproteobacteria bacterium]